MACIKISNYNRFVGKKWEKIWHMYIKFLTKVGVIYLIIFTKSRSVHQVMNVSQMEFGKVNAPYLKIPVQVVIMANLLVEFSANSAHVH